MQDTPRGPETVNSLRRFFSSIRLTISVLILLATTSAIGTLIPQNAEHRAYLQAYGPLLSDLFQVLGLFDMYHSWWFQLLLGILAVNIVVCSLNRWRATMRILRSPDIASELKQRTEGAQAFKVPQEPATVANAYKTFISRRFRRICVEEKGGGYQIRAEKGRWTRTGVYVVHLSVLVLLVGALIGSFFGFDGFVTIPEGASASTIHLRKSDREMPLEFEIRCNDFDVSYYESGAPKEFRSSLTIIDGGRPVLDRDIIVNDPLNYKGVRIYQSSYGQMAPEAMDLTFTHRESGRAVRQKASIGQTLNLPDSESSFTVAEFRNRYSLRGMDVGETVLGRFEKPGAEVEPVVLPLRYPTFDKMRKGEWIVSVTDIEHRYYTGLQISKDPGVPVVYAGFILMLAGCYICFFMSHQKVCIEVKPSANSSSIVIYGSSNRNAYGYREHLSRLSRQLADLPIQSNETKKP